ncbi:phage tail protein [Nocardia sp. NPDC055002]
MDTVVELEGVNGERFILAGPEAGDRGVYLGTGVTGLYDPPVKVVYEEPGNWPGARYLNHRILRRDIVFGVEILNDKSDSWLSRDSEWRKAWAYDRTCKLYVTTENSGTRYLNLALGEQMDISLFTDPNGNSVNRAGVVAIAGDPFWYEDEVMYHVTTQTDTTGITDINSGSAETLTITVDPSDGRGGLNPTDQYVFPKWIVPAPCKVKIPDPSFEDPALFNRAIVMPTLVSGEDCVIDSDPRVEQVIAANDALVWARMNGVRFRHPFPPYTRNHTYNLKVVGCPAGQIFTLVIPRPWSRPWGLE